MSFQQLRSSYFKNSLPDIWYSKRAVATLPSFESDLDFFTATDYANVFELDATTTDVVTDGTNTSAVFLFKARNNLLEASVGVVNITDYSPSATWQGTSTVDAATANVVLQIFNYTTGAWETVATDSTTTAGTTITLVYNANLSPFQANYYKGNQAVFRVYQTSASTTLSTDFVLVWFDSNLADGSASGTVNIVTAATADDGYETGSTSWLAVSGADYLGNASGSRDIGLRFQNVTIPAGATITIAFITVNVSNIVFAPTNYTIKGIKEANPVVWNNTTRRPSQLAKTTASVNGAITKTGFLQTVDFTAVAQELINQGGWASGNAMSFVILNNANAASRYSIIADYQTGIASYYPTLKITYTTGGGVTHSLTRMMMGMGI